MPGTSLRFSWALPLAALAGSVALVYAPVFSRLIRDWRTDDNYSHGFLIVPLAVFFAWQRRAELRREPARPAPVAGLILIAGSLALLAVGTLASEFFVTRISFIGALVGIVLFLLGTTHLRLLAFPLGFLLLMIPIPAIVFNQIAFPLQLGASRLGETVIALAGVPVLREGNVIVLPATTLEVAEACSGLRSLISLLTLGIVFGYFVDERPGVRVGLALATIPLAILTNALRVAGTGVASHYWSPQAAEGFFHTFSGWLIFVTTFAMLVVIARVLRGVFPERSAAGTAPQYS
jgi:exosortase